MGFLSNVADSLSSGSFLGDLASGALGLVGTAIGNDSRMDLAKYNANMQKEFAQNAIQWKVEDAKRAGLHPMAALGVSTSSFSPVSAQFETPDFSFLKDMGQNIDREALAAKDQEARDEAYSFTKASNGLTLKRMGLENQILEMELASKQQLLNSTQVPPSAPKVGGNDVTPDSRNNYGPAPVNLYSNARIGDILLTVLNPDIADSLTESQLSNATAFLAREIEQARNPKMFMDAFKHLGKYEQEAVLSGRAVFEYLPAIGAYMLTYKHWTSPDKKSAGGTIRPVIN